MQTLDQSLFDLYKAGVISAEDALRNADSFNDLRLMSSSTVKAAMRASLRVRP